MRFKNGTKVEVLCKSTEVPLGSWRCAEIIRGNGHYYSIRYDGYGDDNDGEAITARVPRKAIRPCPPVIEANENWKPREVVEVCQNFSWSMAAVLKVLVGEHVLVRLLGSSFEFIVNKIDIRVRQSWQDEKWIVIGKGSSSCGNGKCYKKISPSLSSMFSSQAQKTTRETKQSLDDDYLKVNDQNSLLGSSKTLKRRSRPHVELHTEPPRKFRATDNEHRGGSLDNRKGDDSVSSSVGSCGSAGFTVRTGDLEVATADAESACHCR